MDGVEMSMLFDTGTSDIQRSGARVGAIVISRAYHQFA
jgi:hypothetical protein